MMEQLLEIARRQADAVTVYGTSGSRDIVRFEDGRLKNADSGMNSGTALTVVKNGRQGFAYTRNLLDREGLVRDALAALAGGVEAAGDLPEPVPLPQLDTADEHIGGNEVLVEECRRIVDYLSSRVKGQVNCGAGRGTHDVRVLTSSGLDARYRSTYGSVGAGVLYPGTYAQIHRMSLAKGLRPLPDADLQFIADTYNASATEVKGTAGRTRVLFLPETTAALVWRLDEAACAKAVYEGVSPLAGRIGQKILSERITLSDEPLDDSLPHARAFDDEGTPCRNLRLFQRGVLEGYYNDRFYARKTGTEPTGHGYRADVMSRPRPELRRLVLAPGEHSFADLLKLMGRGVIVAGAMGAHSGNRLNGEYSVGLAPGLWVEDGAIVGIVKDAMVAGNVYDDLNNLIGVGDALWDGSGGRFPCLLLDNVSFSART
jgi:PmbA protein